MAELTLKELLEAGVHFGHQKRKWNPKMKPFIFGERNGIYIIDLEKTVEGLTEALSFVSEVAAGGKTVVFVGTKRQAQDAILSEAKRCGMLYVNRRWLGGTLTNFKTFRSRINKLKELVSIEEDAPSQLTKKEILMLKRERNRLEKNLAGIRDMEGLPGALIVVDPQREKIAVAEANKMGVPIIAMVDTNGDPDMVQHCIPANDDAMRAISLLISKLADAIIEGKTKAVEAFEGKESMETEEPAGESAESVKEAEPENSKKPQVNKDTDNHTDKEAAT